MCSPITLKEETFASGKIRKNFGINFCELAVFAFLARINFREFMKVSSLKVVKLTLKSSKRDITALIFKEVCKFFICYHYCVLNVSRIIL